MKSLTEKQKLVLDFIEREIRIRQQPPTIKEIARIVGSENPRSGLTHIEALVRKGYLERKQGQARSVRLTGLGQGLYSLNDPQGPLEIPILGGIGTGAGSTIPVPSSLFPDLPDFALVVRGESMIGAGIFDGDVAFVQKSRTLRPGEIVVVRIGGEMALRYFTLDRDRMILKAAHPDHGDHETTKDGGTDLLQGRMIGLIRAYPGRPGKAETALFR